MMRIILGMSAEDMKVFLTQREHEIKSFVHAALRP